MARGKKSVRGRDAAAILRQNAIPFMFRLEESKEWLPPTKVVASIGGDPKNAVALAKRLAAAGLVEMRPAGKVAGQPTFVVAITNDGRELLRLLEPAIAFLERGSAEPRSRRKQ